MFWWKKYPNHFSNEVEQLKNCNIYKEDYSFKGNLFISSGEILVRRKTFTKYPIVIVYPEATWHESPKIYLLKELLTKDEINKLSNNFKDECASILRKKINLIYLRHQGSDGSICYLERASFVSGTAEIYAIQDILTRIRDWLISLETGEILFDNNEVQLFAHFPQRTYELRILLTDIFLENENLSGDFFLGRDLSSRNNLYIGFFLINNLENSDILGLPQIATLFINNGKEVHSLMFDKKYLEQMQAKHEIITGTWWQINSEPKPFKNPLDILKLIDNDDARSKEFFFKSTIFNKMNLSETVYLGLRFFNRHREKEWIFFRLTNISEKAFILAPTVNDVAPILSNYKIEAIRSDIFTDKSFHERNSKRANRDILKSKSISIIGCGALGSEISDIMCKAGIDNINLIDNQTIEHNNVVRHVCGFDAIGLSKVQGLQFYLRLHNLFIKINPYLDSVFEMNIYDYVDLNGIGISSIADDNIESYINGQAITYNKIMFYARVLRGGKEARIIRVIPGEDACLECLSLYRADKSDLFIDIPEDPNYPTVFTECFNPIIPASAADIKLTAAIVSRIVINYLQDEKTNENHWLLFSETIGNNVISNENPYKVKSFKIPPHPDCTLCNPLQKFKIRILHKVYDFMVDESTRSNTKETGGILIGFEGRNNVIYILRATGPGPNSTRRTDRFERDIEFCQRELEEAYKNYNRKAIYIGEWHYHPNHSSNPSNIDIISLTQIAESDNYLTDNPLMLIFSKSEDVSCTVHPIGARYYEANYEIINKGIDEI